MPTWLASYNGPMRGPAGQWVGYTWAKGILLADEIDWGVDYVGHWDDWGLTVVGVGQEADSRVHWVYTYRHTFFSMVHVHTFETIMKFIMLHTSREGKIDVGNTGFLLCWNHEYRMSELRRVQGFPRGTTAFDQGSI